MASDMKLDPLMTSLLNILQKLKCPLLNNCEDWWINELFLSPGAHRFQLFDWIFTKLGFNIEAELGSLCKVVKEYYRVFCTMGLCGKSDLNLVEGNATKQKQLKFWERLFDLLYVNMQLTPELCMAEHQISKSNSSETQSDVHTGGSETYQPSVNSCGSENYQLSEHHQGSKNSSQVESSLQEQETSYAQEQSKVLDTEYLKSTSTIANIALNVNMNDLFVEKISLFRPDIEKDIEHILSTNKNEVEKLSDLKTEMKELNDNSIPFACSLILSNEQNSSLWTEELNSTNCEKENTLSNFQTVEKEFTDVYNELKPVLRSADRVFSDVGSKFEEVQPKMELLSKVISYLKVSRSTSYTLEQESNILQDFALNDVDLTGSDLETYISVLQESMKLSVKDI